MCGFRLALTLRIERGDPENPAREHGRLHQFANMACAPGLDYAISTQAAADQADCANAWIV